MLDHAGFAANVRGLGPGSRVVLWVRGCTIGCKGCMSRELWAKGTPTSVGALAEDLAKVLISHDGLTISGGEPFEQAAALVKLIRLIRSKLDIQVLCYSGYSIRTLRGRPDALLLLNELDLLIDGPFSERHSNTRRWRGSDNQELHVLSHRDWGVHLECEDGSIRNLQVQPISGDRVRLIGIPRRGDLDRLRIALNAKGMRIVGDENA